MTGRLVLSSLQRTGTAGLRWFIVVVALLVSTDAGNGQPRRQPQRNDEPFTTFRLLDTELTRVNNAMAALQGGGRQRDSASRARLDLKRNLRSISTISRRAERRYRRLRQPFGARLFKAVADAAGEAEKSANAVRRLPCRNDQWCARLSRAIVTLTLRYQAVSANYAAQRCMPRQYACCEPRKQPETLRGPPNACEWKCVASPGHCKTGITGPPLQ